MDSTFVAAGRRATWILRRPVWPPVPTLVCALVAIVTVVAPFLLMASSKDITWSMALGVPVILCGLLFGALPGALSGVALIFAAAYAENALGRGFLDSVWDYAVAGTMVGFAGGASGWVSTLSSEYRRLLVEVAGLMEKARRDEDALRESAERYRNIFESSRVSLWEQDITELRSALDRLKAAEGGDLRECLARTPELVASCARAIRVINVNDATLRLADAGSKEELLASLDTWISGGDSSLLSLFKDSMIAIADGAERFDGESSAVTLKGRLIDVAVSCDIPAASDPHPHMFVSVMDVTGRRQALDRISRLNRLYAVLSEINHVIAKAEEAEALFAEVCRIAVEQGKFRMAWIGVLDDATGLVRPVASSGFTGSYLDSAVFSARDVPEGRGTVGTAIREGRAARISDVGLEERAAPWREAALAHGYRSLASVSFQAAGRAVGALSVYSAEPMFFDEEEIALIEQIGADLTFALRTIEEEETRRKAEEALRIERNLLRTLVDNLPDSVYVKDRSGRKTMANPVDVRIAGRAAEAELLGRTDLEIYPRDIAVRFLADDRLVVETGLPVLDREEYFVSAEGEKRWLLTSKLPLRDDLGRVVGLVGIGRDITARLEAEAANRLLASAVKQAGEMIMITDAAGAIQYVNPAFEAFTGYSEREVLGRNPRILKSDAQDSAFFEELWRTIAGGKSWSGRIVNRKKDGTTYTESATISPVHDPSGAILNYIAVKRDRTRELLLEEQLRQAQKMESVGRLAGGVAHDFNNMLQVIIGFVEISLPQIDAGGALHKNLQEIRKATQRSSELVGQLLAFARKQTVSPKVLDVNDAVGGTLKMLQRLIGDGVVLAWRPGDSAGKISIDPYQLDQILANLAANARDAISGAGTLLVETSSAMLDETFCAGNSGSVPGDYAVITVRDTGRGMERETLSHLFEPFFTTKSVGKGVGLGLATVYGIVKQNNGFIDVSSEPGRGTTFTIYLPRVHAESLGGTPPEALAPHLPRGSETVLVVDDEAGILDLMEKMLSSLGYAVLTAKTPEEAIEAAIGRPGSIDLLMTDVVMPRMNGSELARRVASIKPGLRCLFVSGYTLDFVEQQGVLTEGVHFISKPFSVALLAEKVREALRGASTPFPGAD